MARERLNSGDTRPIEFTKSKLNKENLKKASILLSYLKPYRGKFLMGMLFLFISSLIPLAFPALLGGMIDATQGKPTFDFMPADIKTIAAVSFSLLFLLSLVSFFRVRFFVEVAEKSLADIRKDAYFKLITLPIDFFNNRRVGELNSRLSADLAQIQDTMTSTLAEIVRQLVFLSGGIVLLILVSPKLTLLNLSILPVLVIIAVVFGRFIRQLSKQAQDRLAASNTIVQETLQGISNVKAFVNEGYEAGRYSQALSEVVKVAVKSATFRGIFASFIIFCIFGAVFMVIWYGSTLVAAGEISVGDLTTYILYSMFVAGSMGSFPELYANIQRALGSSERVLELMDQQQESIPLDAPSQANQPKFLGNITFQEVNFHYPSRPDHPILHHISFSVPAGQKLAIVGPSGSGKTTLASLLLQFYQPQSGQILIDGRPATEYALHTYRNQVAIVPQDVLLFGGTVLENIAYGKLTATQDEIEDAAKRAQAHDFIMALPEGYQTLVGERGVKLSGGQRQRIAIARALLKDPAILLLDEATSSLDSESERLVQEALDELLKNRTAIIIAHRLSTIRDADQIMVLEKGRIQAMGTHSQLMQDTHGLYHH